MSQLAFVSIGVGTYRSPCPGVGCARRLMFSCPSIIPWRRTEFAPGFVVLGLPVGRPISLHRNVNSPGNWIAGHDIEGTVSGTHNEKEREAMRGRLDQEFRKLKAEFAGDEDVHIFSVDDYELDPCGLEWTRDWRGRNREDIKEALRTRPVPDGFSATPMSYTDLHTEEEIAQFEERARTVDPMGNRVFLDPMPVSDFDPDKADLDFRYVDKEALAQSDLDTDEFLRTNASPRRIYQSDVEERCALMDTYRQYDMLSSIRSEDATLQYRDDVPVPPPEDYARWQHAAAVRGGNASVGDSHFLYPAKKQTEFDLHEEQERERGYEDPSLDRSCSVPDQRQAMLKSHAGEWSGVLSVFNVQANLAPVLPNDSGSPSNSTDEPSVANPPSHHSTAQSAGNGGTNIFVENEDVSESMSEDLQTSFPPARAQFTANISSFITSRTDGNLIWETKMTSLSGSNPVSFLALMNVNHNECLAPGRAVFEDGSFVSERSAIYEEISTTKSKNDVPQQFSMSDHFVDMICREAGMSSSAAVMAVAELCLLDHGSQRRRVILCTSQGELSHVAYVCETRGTDEEALRKCNQLSSQYTSLNSLTGLWSGRGLSLHPLCPPLPVAELESQYRISVVDEAPKPQELTYLKEDYTSDRMVDAGPPSLQNRQKLSKRVTAALARDASRVARCRIVTSEALQNITNESHAWESRANALFSPRLGAWVPDYFALALPGDLVVLSTVGKWKTKVRGRVELVCGSRPGRRRMIASRNAEGAMTGIALVEESVVE